MTIKLSEQEALMLQTTMTFHDILTRLRAAGVTRSVRQLRRDFAALRMRPNAYPRRPLHYAVGEVDRLFRCFAVSESSTMAPTKSGKLLTVSAAKRKAGR